MSAVLLMAVGTFLVTLPWGGPLINWLQAHGIGKQIRVDGPRSHEVKRGTPTMGGILFVAPVLLLGALLALRTPSLWAPLGITALFAVLGAIDDWRGLHDITGVGWLARWKFPWQAALGLLSGLALWFAGAPRSVYVPFVSKPIYLGLWLIPAAAFVIVAMANAVNFNDGLDGLASGTSALAFAAYAAIALLSPRNDTPLAALCAAFVGALLAFLWYNVHPAHVIMGDLGSLALGAGLAAVGLMTDEWLLLPVIGAVFVAEMVSVILQVGYFKWSHGRRIFRMTPLHHHFELSGWPETRIVFRAWLLAAVLAMIGVALAMAR